MYDTILVPTDGSAHAVRAADHARVVARAFDATVHVLSVVDVERTAGLFDGGSVHEQLEDRLEAEARDSIAAVEDTLEGVDSVRTAVRRGAPSESILEYVDDHDVGLLAMGTHGRSGVHRYVAGSVTERVVRLADVPVLTVRATERSRVADGYDELLVPTDGSEPATAAVDHAVAIAREVGARIHAVNVLDVGAVATRPGFTPPTELVESLTSEGEDATDRIAEQARAAGVEAVTEVREGFPARDLRAYAEEREIDLIAMGTAGRTGVSRYLLGSTTERLVRTAEMPVFTVGAPADEAD